MVRAMNIANSLRFRMAAWRRYGRSAAVHLCAHHAAYAVRVAVRFATVGLLLVGRPVTSMAAGNALGLTNAWGGTWEVTVDYMDRKTSSLVATDVTTAAICPGMPIKPPMSSLLLRCTEYSGDRRISLLCRAKHSPRRGCNVFVRVKFRSVLTGDTWNGAGHWTARAVGNCREIDAGQDFVVSGTRLDRNPACGLTETSLVERFFVHSGLIPFLGRSTR